MLNVFKAMRPAVFAAILAALFLVPTGSPRLVNSLVEGLRMAQDFVQQHLLYALVPAMALAAVISVSISKPRIIRYMSSTANKAVAYGLASISGAILSVCSCSVLPLFAGIRRMGAGIGPALAFLYSGPAVNVLAIVLTARVLGWRIGLARGVAAVTFGIIIGMAMSILFGSQERPAPPAVEPAQDDAGPPLRRVAAVLAAIIAITVFLTWSPSGFKGVLRCCPDGKTATAIDGQLVGRSGNSLVYRDNYGNQQTVDAGLVEGIQISSVFGQRVYHYRFAMAGLAAAALVTMVVVWFRGRDVKEWGVEAWLLARQIIPLLLAGVFLSGLLLGRPGKEGLIPSQWIAGAVGGNSLGANFMASVSGAFMYFATLTEVPVVLGLMNSGMGHGPALAMLLSGPAVSLPSLLVLGSLMGWRKTAVYVALVVCSATTAGVMFGVLYP